MFVVILAQTESISLLFFSTSYLISFVKCEQQISKFWVFHYRKSDVCGTHKNSQLSSDNLVLSRTLTIRITLLQTILKAELCTCLRSSCHMWLLLIIFLRNLFCLFYCFIYSRMHLFQMLFQICGIVSLELFATFLVRFFCCWHKYGTYTCIRLLVVMKMLPNCAFSSSQISHVLSIELLSNVHITG